MSRFPNRRPSRARSRVIARRAGIAALALAPFAFVSTAAADTSTAVEVVSRATGVAGAAPGNLLAGVGIVSPDGRTSVFSGHPTGFVSPTDVTYPVSLFVRDIVANTTRQVTSSGRSEATGIDKNGRYVSFTTYDPTVRDGDGSIVNASYQLYVLDLKTYAVTLVSRASGANGAAATGARGMIDGNGTAVVFTADNVPGLGSGLFKRNLLTNVTTRIADNPNANWFQDPLYITSVSDDGSKVGFYGYTTGRLVTPSGTITTGGPTYVSADGTTAAWDQVDNTTGTDQVISRNIATGAQTQLGSGSGQPVTWISPDGKQILTARSIGFYDFQKHPARFLGAPGTSWIDAGPFATSLTAPYAFLVDTTRSSTVSRTGLYSQFFTQGGLVEANTYGGTLPGGSDLPPANAYLYVNTYQCASENTQYMTAYPQSTIFKAAKSITGTVSFNGHAAGSDTATSEQSFSVPIPAGATSMHIDLKVTYPDGSTNSGSYDYPVRTRTDC